MANDHDDHRVPISNSVPITSIIPFRQLDFFYPEHYSHLPDFYRSMISSLFANGRRSSRSIILQGNSSKLLPRGWLGTQQLQAKCYTLNTPSPPDETLPKDPVADRIARTLYRQMLRWTQTIPADLPLSSLLPPVTLQPPEEINAYRLEVLAAGADDMGDTAIVRARQFLPQRIQIKPHQLTCLIMNSRDLANLIRVLFRMNSGNEVKDRDHLKDRQKAAFTALKSLNELTARLDSVQNERRRHEDRSNVDFTIGQVVQHKEERWRGVIADWDRSIESYGNDDSDVMVERHQNKKTSLTTKDYGASLEKDESVTADGEKKQSETIYYNIILDMGDAHSMGSQSGWIRTSQTDLEALSDSHLTRIRSPHIHEKFVRFDSETKLFVPSEMQAYNYPSDQPSAKILPDLDPTTMQLCDDIIQGAQTLASRMVRCILDETSCARDRNLQLLANTQDRLQAVADGDVISPQELLASDVSPVSTASHHLRELFNIQLELTEVNARRRMAKESSKKVQFKLGDVVNHTFFGFRGVVVGFDPKPVYDVRQWDGLQHIENPMDQPFYHVVPDEFDCIKAFGGSRGLRYVCQANLEPCDEEQRQSLTVDLDPEWKWDSETESYTPPPSLAYQFNSEKDPDNAAITERCLQRIQNEYNTWHLQARTDFDVDEKIYRDLSLTNVYALLKSTANSNQKDAYSVQETIKEMRKAHPNIELKLKLDAATTLLANGQGETALASYEAIVKEDSTFAEAWNRLATAQFMFGKYDESYESTKKVLELDPLNFQALNGLGLIHFERGDYKEAAEAFRMSSTLDPWSLVSTKLSLTLDLLNRIIYREELP